MSVIRKYFQRKWGARWYHPAFITNSNSLRDIKKISVKGESDSQKNGSLKKHCELSGLRLVASSDGRLHQNSTRKRVGNANFIMPVWRWWLAVACWCSYTGAATNERTNCV